jgi:hypothetical protein
MPRSDEDQAVFEQVATKVSPAAAGKANGPQLGRRNTAYSQVPHDEAIAAFRALGCLHAFVWLYLHYRVWAEGTRTVPLPNKSLTKAGVSRQVKYRALTRLERAGIIRVERRGRRSPLVTLL